MKGNTKTVNKEMQKEMIGILTSISIVSKRLADNLLQLDEKKGENKDDEVKKCQRGSD